MIRKALKVCLVALAGFVALSLVAGYAYIFLLRDGSACSCGPPEPSAVKWLQHAGSAQALFREGDKDANGRLDYARSLTALSEAHLFSFRPDPDGVMRHDGYAFRVESADDFTWSATATPTRSREGLAHLIRGDRRAFRIDESGTVRWRASPDGATATARDPVLPKDAFE